MITLLLKGIIKSLGLIVITYYSENLLNLKKYGQFNGEKTKIISAPLIQLIILTLVMLRFCLLVHEMKENFIT